MADDEQDPDSGLTRRIERELDSLLDELASESGTIPRDDRYSIDVSTNDGIHVLRIAGMVMQSPPDEFVQRLQAKLGTLSDTRLLLDMQECRYLCKEALKEMVSHVQRIAQGAGGVVVMIRPPEKLHRLIDLSGMADLVILVADEAMGRKMLLRR